MIDVRLSGRIYAIFCRFHPECLGYEKNEFRRKFYSGPDSKFVCDECQQRQSTSSPLADGDEDHETSETIRF